MGLDTTHDCWHGSYGGFHQWRIQLAKRIGINLEEMEGFNSYHNAKSWDEVPDHGIIPLLVHSDCDGELSVEECKQIADGLDDILNNIKEDEELPESFIYRVKQFKSGCIQAIEDNEPVEFF